MENTTNSQQQNPPPTETPSEKIDFKSIIESIKQFLHEILDISKDTDKKGTIEDIKGNISMKGHTAWVLVFSILMLVGSLRSLFPQNSFRLLDNCKNSLTQCVSSARRNKNS